MGEYDPYNAIIVIGFLLLLYTLLTVGFESFWEFIGGLTVPIIILWLGYGLKLKKKKLLGKK